MRSRLRRSTPSGGGAGGCCRTGATHHWPAPSPPSRRHPTQRLPWMMGADQWCSVFSRSSRVSAARACVALVSTGSTSALGETSHSATTRPASATLAWRSTSRRRSSSAAGAGWVSTMSQYENRRRNDRAFLRHVQAEMRHTGYFESTMSESAPGLYLLPHTVFLRRLAGATRARSLDARLGRAAFVALRLVDLLDPDQPTPTADAFHYQHLATERACRGLPAHRPDTRHLIRVVQNTADAFQAREVGLLFPALFAYAHYLEDEMRLEEALDVLETLERVGGDAVRAEDQVAARLRSARVLRKLNRFDEAERTYEEAGAQAEAVGDRHSELLSRIGRAHVALGRGNLSHAESSLRQTLQNAETVLDGDAQAAAHHVMAVVLGARGQPTEAVPHVLRAFQLYEDEGSRARALADFGAMLLIVGDPDCAERALLESVRRGGEQDFAAKALID